MAHGGCCCWVDGKKKLCGGKQKKRQGNEWRDRKATIERHFWDVFVYHFLSFPSIRIVFFFVSFYLGFYGNSNICFLFLKGTFN
jgi:hypothetical protein